MEIAIRRATPKDAIFLTSILGGAQRYRSDQDDYLDLDNDEFIITGTYIESNMVLVAEKQDTIIGCCSLHKVEKACTIGGVMVEPGYWLEHLFIRPAYIGNGIGRRLVSQVMVYCKEKQIAAFNALSNANLKGFYSKMGAIYIKEMPCNTVGKQISLFRFNLVKPEENEDKIIGNNNETIENIVEKATVQFVKTTLEQKLFELDKDAAEDELYDEDDLYEEDEFYDVEDELDDNDEVKENVEDTSCDEEIAYEPEDKEIEVQEKEQEDRSEVNEVLINRLSYDEFVKAAVPIGYKFECEEEKEENRKTKKSKSEALVRVKQSDKVKEKKVEKLEEEEIKYERIMNRMQDEDEVEVNEAALEYDVQDETDEEVEDCGKREKEKMLAGEMYIAWGEELVNDRKQARKLLQEFNNTDPENKRLTHAILKELFGKIGEYIHIEPYFNCRYGYNIEVGDNLYIGSNCVILDHGRVTIGDNCIISPQVGIYTLAYPIEARKRVAGYEYAKPVTIGDNVWIGGGSIINPGVTIGNNVVISPGTVVNSDIPDNMLVAGNPAKIINEITR